MICASRRKARSVVGVQCAQIAALEADTAGIGLDQAQHQPAHGGFAAAGFADQRQRLAGLDGEADAVDRLDMVRSAGRTRERSATKCFTRSFDLEQRRSSTPASRSGARMQRDRVGRGSTAHAAAAALRCRRSIDERAARRETAAGRRVRHVRHHALDGREMRRRGGRAAGSSRAGRRCRDAADCRTARRPARARRSRRHTSPRPRRRPRRPRRDRG